MQYYLRFKKVLASKRKIIPKGKDMIYFTNNWRTFEKNLEINIKSRCISLSTKVLISHEQFAGELFDEYLYFVRKTKSE